MQDNYLTSETNIRVWVMMFNATFNTISVISRLPGENHRPVESHLRTLSHNVVSSTHRHEKDLISQR
jgi:hypothetical protein